MKTKTIKGMTVIQLHKILTEVIHDGFGESEVRLDTSAGYIGGTYDTIGNIIPDSDDNIWLIGNLNKHTIN